MINEHSSKFMLPQRIWLFTVIKRTVDIVGSIFLLLIFSPVMLAVSLMIKLSSPGPIIFRQKRVGQGNHEFMMYKFRSMECVDKKNRTMKVTQLGRFLRRTSIDEVPQLFNVVFGDMSLVGPRPLMHDLILPYKEFGAIRLLTKPGITGFWQIKASSKNKNCVDMFHYDLDYIKNIGFLTDIKVLILTIPTVLSGKGAE